MISLNASLEIAKRALQTHQLAMSVIGTNIANVNSPGYSRRRAVVAAAAAMDSGYGYVGAGVEVRNIERARDAVLDKFYRSHMSDLGKWAGIQNYLSNVETITNEPGAGLSDVMGEFWSAWQDLANDPEQSATRSAVLLRGQELCSTFHRLSANFRDLKQSLNEEIGAQISRINELSGRLADLNGVIIDAEVGGHEASGLRDERDLLTDELSEIISVDVTESSDGSTIIRLNSQVLVQGNTHRELELSVRGTTDSTSVVWKSTGREVLIEGGLMEGYITARDEYVNGYLADLDALAGALVSRINSAHSAGYGLDGSTGNNFFDPERVTAADIAIDPALASNLDLIAASAEGEVGDGRNALAIANLATANTMVGGSISFDDFYGSLVGRIGQESRVATSFLEAEELLVLGAETQRLGVSGVSLDEEMAYMLSYQHAYQAMARVVATIDEMMATLIHSLG
ncbi:MAG: flagellar hook-associated protein FlgK [Candidatus Eisenbacteria sp.]|nr:flagellar hook-associated protein FlgK [Candidatus Eisenbacteria bacterium]